MTGDEANLDSELNSLSRCLVRIGRVALLLALLGPAIGPAIFGSRAWSQQAAVPAAGPASVLIDAPEAQVSAANPVPEAALPGSIHGVVVNGQGAVYEGIHIALAQTSSNSAPERVATSDSNGRFGFADVPPGAFTLTFSATGFASRVISGVLHSGESYEAQPVSMVLSTAVSQVDVMASQQEIAQAQVKEEEKQRVLGVIPNYFVTYVPHPSPLTTRQKFNLAWKTSTDPVTFAIAGIFAGAEQATDSFPGYGQGAEGYAKRYGANYADGFSSTMIGGAILPSLLKQDPRYFYKGTGSTRSRFLYAVAMSVVCKGDNGHWQPNYSGILGGLAAGGISNLYYPEDSRDGLTLTFENALIGTAEGAAQNLFQEFFVRKFTPKVPNYGGSKP